MPMAKETKIFSIAREKLYEAIVDYAAYPEFIEGVDKVEILEQKSNSVIVKFYLNLIKEFSYVLIMRPNPPHSVHWELESGDLFKKNEGSWTLKEVGDNETEATYLLDVELKIFMPKMLSKKLVSSNLPRTMESFYQRAKCI